MSKRLIAGITVAVLLTLAGVRAVDLSWWQSQTIAAANQRAANLALILAEYVHENFAAADASLRQLALHSRRVGGPEAADEEWAPSLASARAGLTGVGSISVTDAAGIIRHTTQPAILGQSRADRPIFRALASQRGDDLGDLVVDTPLMTVVEPKSYVLPIGRRLTDVDGRFTGTVVAVIIPALPRSFFRTVDVGNRGVVWVFHPNGVVLFREPSTSNPIGQSASGNPVFAAAERVAPGGSGVIESPIGANGGTFLTSFRRAASPKLIVAVSLDRDEVLADWRHQVVGSIVIFAALVLFIAATLGVLFKQMDAKAAAEHALREAQEREAQQLREANLRLADANRLKDEFLMTVSHELRTPLTAIRGWARMLVSNTLADEKKATALQTIERNACAQTRLIDDLLDVSRLIGGKLRLELRTTDPAEVIRDAVQSVTPAADAKHIRLDVRFDPSAGTIVCDAERLQQVVWNLVSNAIKFTPEGGRVDVRLDRRGHGVEVVVSDSGAGIAPAFLPYVFERFRQQDTGPRRQQGGLGLGLAIVRHLVELHGGTVTAESDGEGRGATFRVRLGDAAAVAAAASDHPLSEIEIG